MLLDDIKSYNREISSRGIIYLVGFLVVLLIGIIKDTLLTVLSLVRGIMVCHHDLFYDTKKKVDEYNGCLFSSRKGLIESPTKDFQSLRNHMEYVGFVDSLEVKDESYYETDDRYIDLYKEERNKIAKSSSILRDTLIKNNSCLVGEILKVNYPKIPLEELGDSEVYLVQHITFGDDLNNAISYLFRIDIKRNRRTKDSYLIFNNGGTIELEEKLKEYLMDEKIRIKLFDKNKVRV